jgi:hypothetical protein
MRVIASVSDLSAVALAKTESNSDFFPVVIPGRECAARFTVHQNPFLREFGVMDSGSALRVPRNDEGCLTFEC